MPTSECRMLNPSIEAAVRQHAADAYPFECCGALIGESSETQGVSISEALALSNLTAASPTGEAADLNPRRRFLVSPEEYRAAEARAAAAGAELVGFYHSHPDHPAMPSQYDLDHAWPNLSYLIVSVRDGVPAELRSWRLRRDRSGFDEEAILSPTAKA